MSNNTSVASYDDDELKKAGFTQAGINRFKVTTRDYIKELYRRSLAFGKGAQGRGQVPEVTQEHVRSAAMAIVARPPAWSARWIICQIGEYLSAGVVGAGAGHLDSSVGIFAFGSGLTIGVILLVLRQLYNK